MDWADERERVNHRSGRPMVKEQSRVLVVTKVQPKLCLQAPEKRVFLSH